jgi:O-antigen ligase
MSLVKKDKLILAILVISLLAIPLLLPSGIREWSRETHSALEFFCNLDRIAFYKSAIQMIKDHPFIGVGINTFMKAYPKYKVHDVDIITSDYCYAHNNYLQMAGEIGLAGLGIFLWMLAAFFTEVWRIYIREDKGRIKENKGNIRGDEGYVRNAALGLGCGIFAFCLNGLTESSFYFSKIVVVFWFIAGLAVSLKFIRIK